MSLKKRSLSIAGHRTSVALEPEFWKALEEIAAQRQTSLSDLVAKTDETRQANGLSSALRLLALEHYRKSLTTPSECS